MKTNPNASLITDCEALRARLIGDGKNLTPHRDVAIAGLTAAIDNLTWEFPPEKSLANEATDSKESQDTNASVLFPPPLGGEGQGEGEKHDQPMTTPNPQLTTDH